jgi:Tol biopolymer transport system component/DNA-binding SARP family transcriptional activator
MGFPSVATQDGTALGGLGPGKPLALLVYLAVRREARREELVDLLWGEVAESNARNAFRQALHRLRTALGEDLVPPDRERVGLTESGAIWIDRDAFLQALDRNDVPAAVEHYRGEFLEGFELGEAVFDSWVDAERVRLRARFQVALQTGAEAALAAGRWLEALQYVQRLSTVAPFDESAALLEANVLVAAGRSGEALMSLRRFAQVLRDQLDLPPSPRIREMLARIERSEPRVESPQTPTSSARAKPPALFVGREEEIGRLMGAVRELSAERGTTMLIEGPSGIGKTRLAEELLGRARSLGPLLVLRGRERPLGASLPYASIAEALREALKAPGIAGTGRHLLGEAARILPELRDTFELPEPAPIEDEGGRLRFFEGVAALLDSAAYEQPICVVLDDMHNASASTLDLMAYLTARLQTSPVLIVLLYRFDTETAAVLARLRALTSNDSSSADTPSEAAVLRLTPLAQQDVVRLVDSIVSTKGVEGQLDIERIAAAADGNPLRAIELARRALNGELPTSTPTRLRDILWERLQKSSPSQRRVFFAAALIQRRSTLRLLAAAAHLPEAAAFEAAQTLEAAGLVIQEGEGFVVAHDFTATFVSEVSGLAGRALLAGWAADALTTEPGATSAELAQLYSIAGQQGPAFIHARRAAYEAAAVGASAEVHRLLGLALALSPDASSRTQVESMLAAFGAGRRLLNAPYGATAATRDGETSAATEHLHADAQPALSSADGRAAPTKPIPRQPRESFATPRMYWLTAGLIVAGILFMWQRSAVARAGRRALGDSLLVVERGKERGPMLSVVTGSLVDAGSTAMGSVPRATGPQWVLALPLPWIRPSVSPDGRFIAIERMTDSGTDVYLLTKDTIGRVPVATGAGSDEVMGWAPDGRSLLVRRAKTLADGGFDADLWAYYIDGPRSLRAVPIDTSSARSIREAAWSPDGTRIAWVAQVGKQHQQDIFVSRADGSAIRNLTSNPGEDYHISWSSDGSLLAFTSDRRGNPDLFAFEFEGWPPRLWTLTDSPYPEDFATFSPDRRYVAFQSTRDSDAAVYVMPALGGTMVRVTPRGGQFSIAGWRGHTTPTYVDRFRVIGSSTATVGDSVSISLLGVDQEGISRLPDTVPVQLLDDGIAELHVSSGDSTGTHQYVLRGIKAGTVRIAASIPGWRYDTLMVRVGSSAQSGLSEDFRNGFQAQRWLALGTPIPIVKLDAEGRVALFPNGDLQWQSGVLSRDALSLRDGVDLTATLSASFAGPPLPAALLEVALVAEVRDDAIDKVAPRFTEYAAAAWDGEASRFTYSVGSESKSDPVSTLGNGASHVVRIAIDAGGTVNFYVDAKLRWTSSLRFLGGLSEPRARVWLGGRATGAWGSIRDLKVVRNGH